MVVLHHSCVCMHEWMLCKMSSPCPLSCSVLPLLSIPPLSLPSPLPIPPINTSCSISDNTYASTLSSLVYLCALWLSHLLSPSISLLFHAVSHSWSLLLVFFPLSVVWCLWWKLAASLPLVDCCNWDEFNGGRWWCSILCFLKKTQKLPAENDPSLLLFSDIQLFL